MTETKFILVIIITAFVIIAIIVVAVVVSVIIIRNGKGYQNAKTYEFSENFQRDGGGGVIFNPKIYIANFGPLYSFFFRRFPKKIAL